MAGLTVRLKKNLKGFSLDVSWSMGDELAVLFGPSGSGKTMTLKMIAGLVRPDEGFLSVGDRVLFDGPAGVNVPPQGRSMGYVFQDLALFPHMTVRENIAYGLRPTDSREAKDRPKYRPKGRIEELAGVFRLSGLEDRYPADISGGQKQRVALARALAGNPDALILDEPFSSLDMGLRAEMRGVIKKVRQEFRIPVVLVTHDPAEASELADRVILYSEGRAAYVEHKALPRAASPLTGCA